ncbi:MAG: tetratricopeptide repeat protein [Planctomycetes bacterium]|nr:tetratricopeptide repeat protein [Planctomycetota bacterium]
MNVRPILLPLLLLSPSPLFAQTGAVLGRDDATFARRLFERGYTDLSEKLVALIEKGEVAPKDQADIKALHLAVRLDLAQRENDPYKRKDLLQQVITEKEDLVKQYSGTSVASDTALTLPDTYSLLGAALLACIAKEKDVNLIAQLQQEGQKAFTSAEEKIKSRIETLEEHKDDPTLADAYISARFNLPKTYYFHSLLYPAGDFAKKKLLEDAVQGFQEFGLDYNDTLLNYEGCTYCGLCYKELGEVEDAKQSFNEAIRLREDYFEKDAKGVYQTSPAAADVISKAVLQKVNTLVDAKDERGAIDCAKDFFATILEPYDSLNGLAILASMGRAQLAVDPKACMETADKLIELDGGGPWGAVGRELQGNLAKAGAEMDSAQLLKIAQSYAQKGLGEKALPFARLAIQTSKGEKNSDKTGEANAVDAWLLSGAVYAQRGWAMEAALAFDTCAERYPNAAKAPEAVYQALMQYVQLASAEKKQIFKTRVEERRKALTTKYPTHDRAAYAQLVEGDGMMGEGKFLEAVDSYTKIQASSPSYYDAQLRIGSCYYMQARTLDKDGKKTEAAQYYTQAETILKKSIGDFDRLASSGTLDLEKLSRYEKNGFNARRQLADLYLQTNKFDKVLPLLEGADSKYANDPDTLSQVWGLRIRALKEQGKLEDAIKLLDALVAKEPDSKAVASGAGLIAREIDQLASAASAAKKTKEANDLWKRAATYYGLSGRALLKGDTIRPREVEDIAQRLYVIGLIFNGVPEGQDTFIGWEGKLKDSKLWEQSADLYQAGLKVSPSTDAQLNLARISAFLGRWKLASDAYGEYLNGVGSVFDPLDAKRLSNPPRPDAILATIERGACDMMVATGDNDKNRYDLAEDTLFRLYAALPVDSTLWWYSSYYLVRVRYERGSYREACDLLQRIERSVNRLGGETSLVPAFVELKKQVDKKCP